MKTLKKELVRKTIFHTRAEARDKIFEYIEMFYNSKRRHSFLDFISPNEFEKRYTSKWMAGSVQNSVSALDNS
ncbi:IS3 family transposase [Aliarcobacter cryaerophilus]|uniref:IS3 family transposase n=1 Tax=Aliarcobacter cryaerophilus TaxID=28198 RepID=UPI003DA560DF